jgi:hypothetical protein
MSLTVNEPKNPCCICDTITFKVDENNKNIYYYPINLPTKHAKTGKMITQKLRVCVDCYNKNNLDLGVQNKLIDLFSDITKIKIMKNIGVME